RLALEKRAPVYETSPRTVGNRLEKRLAGPHERIFVPFKSDKNRRGREGNANGTYEFVGLQEVRPIWFQRGKRVNASFTFSCFNFRFLEVSFTLLLLSHYIRLMLRFLFSSGTHRQLLPEG
ncbi:hypothetical protein ALC57_03009, partial [Trachymyrmex cornetzi]